MTHTRHLGRFVAAGVGALVLSGAGIASATTPPTEPPGDTAMGATSEPMAGAGPSNCPAITEEAEATATSEATMATEAPAGTESMATEAPAGTESMATEAPAGTEAMSTEAAGSEPTGSVAAVSGPFVQVVETDEYGPILAD